MEKRPVMFYENAFEELKSDFQQNKEIVLFLGAGINCGEGVDLSWHPLMTGLLREALFRLPLNQDERKSIVNVLCNLKDDGTPNNKYQSTDNVYIASLIKLLLGEHYINFLRSLLYNSCNKAKLEKDFLNHRDKILNVNNFANQNICTFYTLFQVAKLIILSKNIKAIVTYNYDNFLFSAIEIIKTHRTDLLTADELNLYDDLYKDSVNGIQVKDIYLSNDGMTFRENYIPIFHVHGFIPSPTTPFEGKSENIVLAYDEYFNNLQHTHSWQTTTQLHFLENYTSIFMGVSLNDWNMLRIIDLAKKNFSDVNTFAFFLKTDDQLENNLDRLKNTFLKGIGVKSVFISNTYTQLYQSLNTLVNLEK